MKRTFLALALPAMLGLAIYGYAQNNSQSLPPASGSSWQDTIKHPNNQQTAVSTDTVVSPKTDRNLSPSSPPGQIPPARDTAK